MDLRERMNAHRTEERKIAWTGTFADYFALATANPAIAALSHARVYGMITGAGVQTEEGKPDHYAFFDDEIYGIDETVQQVVEYFRSAAARLEVRKRILLLMGPVGGGKSSIVSHLKHGLEQYSRQDAGAMYAIAGCPMHEEPLHLVPPAMRAEIEKEYGLYIEGDLCPHCRYQLEHTYRGVAEEVPVERIVFSEKERIGIGTFQPSDPKCVTGDTLVLTDRGLVSMEDLFLSLPQRPGVDEFAPLGETVYGIDGAERATQFYSGGIQPIHTVETALGFTIRGTANHPLRVLGEGGVEEWVKISDLRPGMHVAIARGIHVFPSTPAALPAGAPPLARCPTEMTPQLAYWLGLLIAEGSITEYETWFANGNPLLIDRFLSLTDQLFGLAAVPHRKADTYNYNVSISSKALCTWLRGDLGLGRGARAKTIPTCILTSGKEEQLAFLEGLFWGDATIRGTLQNTNVCKFTSRSQKLARQVQISLLNLGIVSGLTSSDINDELHYTVAIQGDQVLDLVALIPSLRAMATAPLREERTYRTSYDIVPFGQTLLRQAGGDENLARILRGERGLTTERARNVVAERPDLAHPSLATLLEKDYLWLTVRSISIEEAEPVYDLVVPGTHSFIADGFIQHNSQDVAELVGGIDFSTIAEVGAESDPRAYRFDGELNIANRGVMEFVEMLKTDEKFLYVLLTLSQEQAIKAGRFSMIYADEVVLSHTNEHEYASFVGNKKSEAMQDRIILVRVPYNLRVSDEVKIYAKLLKQSTLASLHIAPYTLETAATFAILSRLEVPKKAGMSLMKKLKLYDGQVVEGYKEKDLKEIKEETVREGMDGISPRYVINRISTVLARTGATHVTPIDVLRSLKDGLDQHTSVTKEERERLLNLLADARKEYDEIAKREVQKAFVYAFEESAKTLFDNYLDNVEAYCNKTKVKDPITDEDVEPDEKLMRGIEEQVAVSESGKGEFRNEILIRISALARRGAKLDYAAHERLKEAIEKKLFTDMRDVVKITTSTKTPDAEQLKRINNVVDRLVSEQGYTAASANDLLKYVGALLNR